MTSMTKHTLIDCFSLRARIGWQGLRSDEFKTEGAYLVTGWDFINGKFCNGDTVMARITPCLENGKTAYVDMLDDGEIGFGSTEFIVMRAKTGISDPQFVYYTAINPVFRNVAIKSMVGSSGRQRVQQSVLEELELSVPDLDEQRRIGDFLARIDEKIALNDRINDNLYEIVNAYYTSLYCQRQEEVANMKEKNLAVELLKKLISEQVSVYRRTNIVKSEKFSEIIQSAMNR